MLNETITKNAKAFRHNYGRAFLAAQDWTDDDVTIFTQVKDEAKYLLEWIAYGLTQKFTRFVIFNNGSKDGTTEMLSKLAAHGQCVHIPWPTLDQDESAQLASYDLMVETAKDGVLKGWLCVMDCDEFFVFHKHNDVVSFLQDYPEASAIAINWLMYGSAGKIEEEEGLVVERFTKRSKVAFPPNRHTKSFMRADKLIGHFRNSHFFKVSEPDKYLFPDRSVFPGRFSFTDNSIPVGNTPENFEIVQMNHYAVKSKNEWLVKRVKGRGTRAATDEKQILEFGHFTMHDKNDVEDPCARNLIPTFAEKLEELRAIVRE